jgi:tetratricopeptide (TPR) repeat protein
VGCGAAGGPPGSGGRLRSCVRAARRVGFADHAAFALAALGSAALAGGDVEEAEELERRALAVAEAANAAWVAAHVRVQLGRIAAAAGDTETAGGLYREVLEWSHAQRPHGPRESLFLALAGSPAASAERALAELAR